MVSELLDQTPSSPAPSFRARVLLQGEDQMGLVSLGPGSHVGGCHTQNRDWCSSQYTSPVRVKPPRQVQGEDLNPLLAHCTTTPEKIRKGGAAVPEGVVKGGPGMY